ncbi:patatin-like phospholipase family protein [Methylobacterium sp. E-041]|jgi:predicted acylesterase/phospholipase RssA|uniref:patatin-like phospholipase family protein n=1 Tax=unclassified Methylobacterium TaxID=2615210 RepID=UPI001FB9ADAF|nr:MULTISPECIES: patatin-like phospholipase family protein [unclassified Methylobacterium]MCJ2104539.1 patatin-like phospholipase family protein [Methylobacterium sp. E-041]MCJ2114576.1 patatin-like phospholipase family protein [Methylobacterium sp. E-025]
MPSSKTRQLALCATILALGIGAPDLSRAGSDTAKRTERTAFTAGEIATARPAALKGAIRIAGDDGQAFQALIDGASAAADPWLVLSGGGENGAFAAGLLSGWSASGRRPAFGVITGVSTGALIAPFAFIGAAGDAALREAYTTVSAADVFEFGGSAEALTDTWPLKRRIEKAVTPRLLKAIAAEHAKGRRLLVATTELDTERPVLWDMGAIATIGDDKALNLFRSIVLASSAVPGVFPPVSIDSTTVDGKTNQGKTIQEMHVDGGTTAPFFLAPKPALIAAQTGAGGVRIPARTVYLVVNNKLAPYFQMATHTTLSVLGRAMSSAIKAQTRDALALADAFARRESIDLKVAEIDDRFTDTSPAPFDQRYMKALFAHAEKLGQEGTAFGGPEALAEGSSNLPTGSLGALHPKAPQPATPRLDASRPDASQALATR